MGDSINNSYNYILEITSGWSKRPLAYIDLNETKDKEGGEVTGWVDGKKAGPYHMRKRFRNW